MIDDDLVKSLKLLEDIQDCIVGETVYPSILVRELAREDVEAFAESKLEALWELNGLGNRGKVVVRTF